MHQPLTSNNLYRSGGYFCQSFNYFDLLWIDISQITAHFCLEVPFWHLGNPTIAPSAWTYFRRIWIKGTNKLIRNPFQYRHMSVMPTQRINESIVCSSDDSDWKEGKHQSSTLLALCEGNHWWPVDSPYKGTVIWKAFLCYEVMSHTGRLHAPITANIDFWRPMSLTQWAII